MWKALFFAACVATFHMALACDDDVSPTTPKPQPTEPTCGCGGPPKCPKNEIYDDCKTTSCRPKLCSELGYPLNCDKKCKPGCVCKDGYVRNDKGICIPIKNCPSCGGDENAQTGCGSNCGKRCSDIGKQPIVCPLGCILNGCECRDGYWYDSNQKKCVKKEDCTPICKENEVYSPCVNGECGPKNCSQINQSDDCPMDPRCVPGCICKKGYLRDDVTGKCVPKDQCIPKCPKNEEYDNCKTNNCRPTLCSELGFPLDCDKKCKSGCKCKNGYVRNDKGICIPINDCPSCGGDKNAQSGCGNNCGKMCGNSVDKPRACPASCNPNGCDCRDGYQYDTNQRKCVKICDCTPICKKNEVYSPCANGGCGPKNCSQINDPKICIDPICIKGCVCKEGYLRDDDTGKCIPKDQCIPKCPKNEEYDDCKTNSCRPSYCSELGFPLDCDKKCKPGCKCKDGYVRNDKGVCIPVRNCPSCGGDENAESGCGTNCGKTCDCSAICLKICKINSCDCRDGYYFDANQNKCVKKEDCTPICTEKEVYSPCINGGCGPRNCSEINQPAICVDPKTCRCIKGCICKEGLLRADNGTCIPKDQCPQNCPGKNEYYEPCIYNCGSQNCSDRGKIYHCPIQKPGKCDSSGCRCKPGYLRDDCGVCILEKDCPPPTCPKGEMWNTCPTVPCDGDNCPKDRNSPQTCPIGIVCSPPRCTCSIFDKRAKNGTCIRIEDCPPFCCDGPNEHHESCPVGCPGETCTDYLNGSKCPPYKIGIVVPCRPACRCDKGHYRNAKGICVPACDCAPKTTTPKPTTPLPCGCKSHGTTTTPEPTPCD